jgi:hypothetical protein
MSIRKRIEDADLLFQCGRKEGALLLVLIAVAATSRKRYPRKDYKDKKAFEEFVCEEMSKYAPGWKKDTKVDSIFQGEPLWMPKVLYELIRCNLAHEAELPIYISFEDGKGFNVSVINNEKLVIGNGIFHYLKKIVIEAPENAHLFDL